MLPGVPELSEVKSAAGVMGTGFEAAFGGDEEPIAFADRGPMNVLMGATLKRLSGQLDLSGDLSSRDLIDLKNRQVRYDVIQVVIDRGTGTVREKSYRNDATGDRSFVDTVILRE